MINRWQHFFLPTLQFCNCFTFQLNLFYDLYCYNGRTFLSSNLLINLFYSRFYVICPSQPMYLNELNISKALRANSSPKKVVTFWPGDNGQKSKLENILIGGNIALLTRVVSGRLRTPRTLSSFDNLVLFLCFPQGWLIYIKVI